MRKLKLNLKNLLKKETFLVDIFLFGSFFKGKDKPNDIDLIVLVRVRDYEKIEAIIYSIKKIGEKLNIDLHIEPLVIDDIHNQKVYVSLLHEGFSLKHNHFLNELLSFGSFMLYKYNLHNQNASEKVRFSYALYGRKKGEGLLANLNGKELGKGSILIPTSKQEIIKNFFNLWKVHFDEHRIFMLS